MKLVLESEQQKYKVPQCAKNLRLSPEGARKKVCIRIGEAVSGSEKSRADRSDRREQPIYLSGGGMYSSTSSNKRTQHSTSHYMKCLYTNANSVIGKIDELRQKVIDVIDNGVDIVGITET